MLAVLWGLFLAAQTVTALLFPKQQQLVNYRRKDDFSPTSYQFQAWKPVLPKKQEWTPLLPKHQVIYEEDSRSENQHQRMFHLPHKVVAFHHQSHGLSPKVQQDEHRRSMALPESLVAQQNISFAKENIQAAMVQKVVIGDMLSSHEILSFSIVSHYFKNTVPSGEGLAERCRSCGQDNIFHRSGR